MGLSTSWKFVKNQITTSSVLDALLIKKKQQQQHIFAMKNFKLISRLKKKNTLVIQVATHRILHSIFGANLSFGKLNLISMLNNQSIKCEKSPTKTGTLKVLGATFCIGAPMYLCGTALKNRRAKSFGQKLLWNHFQAMNLLMQFRTFIVFKCPS